MNTEVIGYVATALTLSSFLFTDMVKLRTINLIGCLGWTAYALGLPGNAQPILVVNVTIAGIHGGWLIRNHFKTKTK